MAAFMGGTLAERAFSGGGGGMAGNAARGAAKEDGLGSLGMMAMPRKRVRRLVLTKSKQIGGGFSDETVCSGEEESAA
jgi:hypothetical protein